MMSFGRILLIGCWVLVASGAPLAAVSSVLADRSDLGVPNNFTNVSSIVAANDFSILRTQRLTAVDLFVCDDDFDGGGVFDQFDGTIGWAIYDNGAAGHPGNLVASGSDATVTVVDTGVDILSNDIFRVRMELDPPVTLDSGSWWLAIHEGAWGAAWDGDTIHWAQAGSLRGMPAETAGITPTTWTPTEKDHAFVLYGSEVIQADEPDCCVSVDISLGVWATPFANPGGLRPTQALTWMLDGTVDDDGELGAFSGTLGWAIYADGGGAPSGDPVASGQDTTPGMTDTGTNLGSVDLVRVAIDLDGVPALGGGTYWLALHEGAWGSPYDASAIRWLNGSAASGTTVGSWQVVAPEGSWTQSESWSSALVVFPPEGEAADLIHASGFDDGVACAWSAVVGGTLCP